MAKQVGSEAVTQGVRIAVQPRYLVAESSPEERRYVFAYHITMTNQGSQRARLKARHWIIVDAHGRRRDVAGPGVVGEFPDLAPGEHYEYSSYCPLETSWGTMEGSFEMERESGETFSAEVKRFYLVADPAEVAAGAAAAAK